MVKYAKYIFFNCIILLLVQCKGNISSPGNFNEQVIIKEFQKLLREKEFFKLEALFEKNKSSISPNNDFYFHAFLDEAFNRNEQALLESDSALEGNDFNDSALALLAELRSDCYYKMGAYRQAADEDSLILHRYYNILPKYELEDIRNKYSLHTALINVSPISISKISVDTLSWSRDKIGVMEIPVKTGVHSYLAIFDTHANISSISESYASRLCLKILRGTYSEGSGATGIAFKTHIGIADSLYIGHILLRNVVFEVMPDKVMSIKSIDFSMNIVVGLNIISNLGEIDIYRDNKMVIPALNSVIEHHNLALNGLKPIISLRSGNDTLLFDFDTGANGTECYATFFRKYKKSIMMEDSLMQIVTAGAGGERKMDMYIMPKLNLRLKNHIVTLDSIGVFTKDLYEGQRFFGNIGQDFIRNFNELRINFTNMYVDGR